MCFSIIKNMKYLPLLLIIGAVIANNCGGNCPGNNCPTCPCGTTKRPEDVANVCKGHSWSQKCCICIVNNESGGNGNAVGYNNNKTYDVGLFQINTVNWQSCNGGSPPCPMSANLKCAIMVYKWGNNTWKFWATAARCGCANTP